jgi:L-threonylcarbamoyladenylate synthase
MSYFTNWIDDQVVELLKSGKVGLLPSENIPSWLQLGSRGLAIRMPANQELRDLIAKVGPIISTSANLEGEKPANSAKEAQEIFGEQLDFYVDIGKLEGEPSTLVAINNEKLKVVRQGSLKIKP